MAENVCERVGDDALLLCDGPDALHGEGFAGARLAVGEDGAIVALDDTVDKGESSLFVDIALKGVGAEHMVESERLGCLLFITFEKINLIRLGINLHNGLTI